MNGKRFLNFGMPLDLRLTIETKMDNLCLLVPLCLLKQKKFIIQAPEDTDGLQCDL